MKKRFVSMALSLLMLFTAFATAGCGEEETPDDLLSMESTTSKAMTLSIWGIKGEGTTDEAVEMVEAAMSKITQVQFNTAIELNLVDEDEYKEVITAKLDEIQAKIDAEKEAEKARKEAEKEAKKRGETVAKTEAPETTAETEEQTATDEYGLPTTLYPAVEEDQLDIFLITDYSMLTELNDKKMLSGLDEEISGNSKLLRQYIHPTIISAGKVGTKTVAIPNQQMVGEYTYMLVNKDLLDKYYWDIDTIETLADAYDFILDVKREEPEYEPLVGDLSPININYFSINGEKTIFGSMLSADKKSGDDFAPRFLFAAPEWSRYIKLQKKLEFADCIGSETFTAEDKFGVGIMKGTAIEVAEYEDDYHVVVLQAPQGTTENIYNGMFAVSTYTKSVARSMEVITYLNTRSDLRNLFAYGIEGVHYNVGEDGVVDVISDDYSMKLEYTGNCFMAHVPEGKPANYWDIAKAHNIELVLSPYFQFGLDDSIFYTADKATDEKVEDKNFRELYEYIMNFSAEFYVALDATTNSDEVEELLDEWWEICDDDEADGEHEGKLVLWVNTAPLKPEGADKAPMSMGKVYSSWSNTRK